jgi:3-hydroxy-5-methyl-1-naphthoate 3-O-methyltransferase
MDTRFPNQQIPENHGPADLRSGKLALTALPPTSDDRAIWDIWLSLYHFACVTVAIEVGTFAAISDEALTTETLAAKLDLDVRALTIHLGLLAGLGLVERREEHWRATATARTWLHPEGQGFFGPLFVRFRQSQPLHDQLKATLKTGGHAGQHVSSLAEWERGEMPQEMADHITAFMNAHSIASSKANAMQPVYGSVSSLLDVGGGSGIFSIEVTRAWPNLRATVMEIESVANAAQHYIDASGVADRVSTRTVDMFRHDWPTKFDAHFFSNIFHDWSNDTCCLLAGKSFAALPPGGTILLHEMLMDDDGCVPLTTASFSMLMLLGTKGRQYKLAELRGFLESAGFTDVEAVRTGGGYYSLVTARKP